MSIADSRAIRRRVVSQIIIVPCVLALAGCESGSGGGGIPPASGGGGFTIFQQPPPEPAAPDPNSVWPPRAVWVVRQKYSSPEEIAALMQNIRDAGLNTVLFQVRGNGTAYYRSSIEPSEYAPDPGFDPLAVACREAHRRGLALQAWVNVMPAWKGKTPPSDPRQLYNAHPDWFWYDQRGQRQPLANFYVSVNPCRPEVRQYLVSVFREIVQNYPVDGLHMDYIRFPSEESPRGSDYPYDAETLALYRSATGKRPQDDKAAWSAWRRQQVTQLVREVRRMTSTAGRTVRLTASVGVDFARWRADHFQDGPAWLREKLVDCVFVMNYNRDTSAFIRRQQAWHDAAAGAWVAAGIGAAEQPNPAVTIEQLKLAAQWGHGFSLFSASSLFSNSPDARRRLDAIRPTLLSMQPRPAAMIPPQRPALASSKP
jgi:uncharacterized lipoprotein YddW (UPF0748 family)